MALGVAPVQGADISVHKPHLFYAYISALDRVADNPALYISRTHYD